LADDAPFSAAAISIFAATLRHAMPLLPSLIAYFHYDISDTPCFYADMLCFFADAAILIYAIDAWYAAIAAFDYAADIACFHAITLIFWCLPPCHDACFRYLLNGRCHAAAARRCLYARYKRAYARYALRWCHYFSAACWAFRWCHESGDAYGIAYRRCHAAAAVAFRFDDAAVIFAIIDISLFHYAFSHSYFADAAIDLILRYCHYY